MLLYNSKSNYISSYKFLIYFVKKTLFFLFYISTFTKHPHQFIYSIHLFNKILILFIFFIIFFPLLLSRTLSQSQHKPKITHTQPPNHHHQTHPPNHHHQPTIINHHHPTENPNRNSKPHRKSRPLNPIINDSHRLDPQWPWSSRPWPHTKTPWHQRRCWSCPGSNEFCPPCLINSPSSFPFPKRLLDQRG